MVRQRGKLLMEHVLSDIAVQGIYLDLLFNIYPYNILLVCSQKSGEQLSLHKASLEKPENFNSTKMRIKRPSPFTELRLIWNKPLNPDRSQHAAPARLALPQGLRSPAAGQPTIPHVASWRKWWITQTNDFSPKQSAVLQRKSKSCSVKFQFTLIDVYFLMCVL